MKNNNFNNPYATLSINKVTSPKNTKKDQPKASTITTGKDLRGGRK